MLRVDLNICHCTIKYSAFSPQELLAFCEPVSVMERVGRQSHTMQILYLQKPVEILYSSSALKYNWVKCWASMPMRVVHNSKIKRNIPNLQNYTINQFLGTPIVYSPVHWNHNLPCGCSMHPHWVQVFGAGQRYHHTSATYLIKFQQIQDADPSTISPFPSPNVSRASQKDHRDPPWPWGTFWKKFLLSPQNPLKLLQHAPKMPHYHNSTYDRVQQQVVSSLLSDNCLNYFETQDGPQWDIKVPEIHAEKHATCSRTADSQLSFVHKGCLALLRWSQIWSQSLAAFFCMLRKVTLKYITVSSPTQTVWNGSTFAVHRLANNSLNSGRKLMWHRNWNIVRNNFETRHNWDEQSWLEPTQAEFYLNHLKVSSSSRYLHFLAAPIVN